MPNTNTFFSSTTGYSGEQNLVDDLVREQIKIYGVDMLYMPRHMVNLDRLLHEATKSVFELAMPMPLYIKSFSGYDNSMEMLTKFGVRASDELTLVMSRSEWLAYYAPFVKGYYNSMDGEPAEDDLNPLTGQTARRPKEGDLIFNPFDDSIFEIKYVMFDQPFFMLGKGYVFELQCEKFEFSGEDFDTGIEEVDDVQFPRAYYRLALDLRVGGTGTFKLNEKVKLYNIKSLPPGYPDVEPELQPFKFFNDAGFTEEVDFVEATVMNYDAPNRKLFLGDLSNLDPNSQLTFANTPLVTGDYEGTEYPAGYYEAIYNDFQFVKVVGENGAEYITDGSTTAAAPFDDSKDIQEEFDKIKILDIVDQNPFGFY
jgi:hypothetical protein